MSNLMTRASAMTHAVDFLKRSEIRGAYYEFGVSTGQTATFAMNAARNLAAAPPAGGLDRFFLFDSFLGLPPIVDPADQLKDYSAIWEGRFAIGRADVEKSLRKAGHDLEKVRFIPGFYEESLIREETIVAVAEQPAALVHIDCDLYTAARDALTFMTNRFLDGALLMFDDWFIYRGRPDRGVQKAFAEWAPKSGLMINEYFRYHWAGICFICNLRE
jgi:O-methyltransferase